MAMPDSEAKKKWIKDNTIIFSIKLMKRTETDIIEFLDKRQEQGISKATVFKAALREYILNHSDNEAEVITRPGPAYNVDEIKTGIVSIKLKNN